MDYPGKYSLIVVNLYWKRFKALLLTPDMKIYPFIVLFLLVSIALQGQSGEEEDCGFSCYCMLERANRAANINESVFDPAKALKLYRAAELCYQNANKQDSVLVVRNRMSSILEKLNELKAEAETKVVEARGQAKVTNNTEIALLSTYNRAGATYNDFGNDKKKEDYLAYPSSPNDIFIGFGIANRLQLNAFPFIPADDVLNSSLEVVDSDALLPVSLGYWYQRSPNGFFSAQLQFQEQELQEIIEAEAVINQEVYQIQRMMDMDIAVLVLGVGKTLNNFHIYAGLESTYLYTQYQPTTTFIFTDQEALATILPDAPVSDLSNNQILVEQEQLRQSVSYLNLSVFWQLSYRFPIGDNFFVGLQANNILPIEASLLSRLEDEPFSGNSLWNNQYAIDYDAIRVKSISYLQIQLGYHFNREKRIKERLELHENDLMLIDNGNLLSATKR
jgi:hypothetical protein